MAKRALCIGINDYPGSGADLAGCVNDAKDWAEVLSKRQYTITPLLNEQATGTAIRDSIERMLHDARPGDVVVVTYSGHGTWVPDLDADEPDGRDEALCPYDYRSDLVTDDDLYRLFTGAHRRVRCVFISDSCHSGTVNRLAEPLGRVSDAGGWSTPAKEGRPQRQVRFLAPEQVLAGERIHLNGRHYDSEGVLYWARSVTATPTGRSRATALLLAGCADTEYSYDAWFGNRPNGAFSRVAIDRLAELPHNATYRDWHRNVRAYLPSQDYPQAPQLTGGSHQKRWPVA